MYFRSFLIFCVLTGTPLLAQQKATVSATGGASSPVLFPASIGKTGKLSRRRLVRTDAADMLKRLLKQAELVLTLPAIRLQCVQFGHDSRFSQLALKS
jgi:hypothetical protein